MSTRDPWDFSDRIDLKKEEFQQRERENIERPLLAEIDALRLENRGLTRQKEEFFAEFERLRKERDDANKIAAAAKTEIERLVAEVKGLKSYIGPRKLTNEDWNPEETH